MYKRYTYKDIDSKSVYVVGDIHGEWALLKYKIKECGITDAIIIIAGDCGIGFEKPQYYKDIYNSMRVQLKKANVILLCVRGNHDDPSYYDGNAINEPYFKAIPDYSIITVGDNEYNILCVGGATSIDRMYRISYDAARLEYSLSKTKSYWENESPVYSQETLDEMFSDGVRINAVVTHSSPKFAPLLNKENIENWLIDDPTLEIDINNEREIITKIYNHLVIKDKHNISSWMYGHFHCHEAFTSNEGVNFMMLDRVRLRGNTWDVFPIDR